MDAGSVLVFVNGTISRTARAQVMKKTWRTVLGSMRDELDMLALSQCWSGNYSTRKGSLLRACCEKSDD